jgi:TPR repeat protein
MRYRAPARADVSPDVFERLPLADWNAYREMLAGAHWPTIDTLNRRRPADATWQFVAQTPALLADGLHYEQRIAECGEIATRTGNWHDLFNALVWLRHAALKQALNARQMAEIVHMGPKLRSRAQYALTHFDEAGVLVTLADPSLLDAWDRHDWFGLFWEARDAWRDGSVRVEVFGHALLEHALTPEKLLVGKALVCVADAGEPCAAAEIYRRAIAEGECLRDPLELRPLPLAGLPGWHPGNETEAFHRSTPCYQPLRAGRRYPPPLQG